MVERLSIGLLGLEVELQPVAGQMLAAAEAIAARHAVWVGGSG
jgi:hypothetical protein